MENTHQEKSHPSIQENSEGSSEKVCKICHSSGENESQFAHPCKCKGSLKYIHTECLNEWIKLTNTKKCDICNYPFKFQKKFKINTPKTLPVKYVLFFILKTLWTGVFNVLCFLFFTAKIVIVVSINSVFFESFFYSPKNISSRLFFNISYLIANIFHYIYIRKIYSCLTSLRSRIQTSHVLQNLINDVSLRSESTVITNIHETRPETRTESEDSDEQEAEISQMVEINLVDIVFKVPTVQGVIDDARMILLMSIISIVYPIIYFISEYIKTTIKGSVSLLIKADLNNSNLLTFLDRVAAFPVLWGIFGSVVFFSVLLVILGHLRTHTSRLFIRHIFYIVKCYCITIFSSIIMTFLVGILSHYLFVSSFNRYEPVSGFTKSSLSLLVHCLFGTIFLYISKHFKDKLRKSFRTGLISNILKDESVTSVVEYSNNLSVPSYLLAVSSNFVLMMAIPFTVFYLSSIHIGFRLRFEDRVWLFILLKTFLVLHRNIKEIAEFFAGIVSKVTRVLSKLFDADNYLYNAEIPVPDKSMLVWGLNKKHCSSEYLSFIRKINETITSEAAIKNQTTSKETVEERSSFTSSMDEVSSHTSNNINELPGNNSIDSSSMRRRMTSSSLINTVSKNEENKILEKYRINEKRIRKYYGKTHDRRISIFYKPKFFGTMKFTCLLISLFLSCLVFNMAFRFSYLLCSLFFMKRSEAISAFFIYFSSASIVLISHIPFILRITRSQLTRFILNNLVFSMYSNIIFPFVGALSYVIMNAGSSRFIQFSNAFIFLNSISSVTSLLFETFFVFSRLETYSCIYFLKQIGSFMVLKLAIFFCFLAYTKAIVFTSMYIPIFFTGIATLQIIRITRILFSGTLLENIRDHFFLDEVDVVNYDPTEEREAPINCHAVN